MDPSWVCNAALLGKTCNSQRDLALRNPRPVAGALAAAWWKIRWLTDANFQNCSASFLVIYIVIFLYIYIYITFMLVATL